MNHNLRNLISGHELKEENFLELLQNRQKYHCIIQEKAMEKRDAIFGRKVFMRALIELSSYCVKDCYYCGLRKSNREALRYRLSAKTIFLSAKKAYELGFRTFVLQGGEDVYFNDELLTEIIQSLKESFKDAAITLSLGERSYSSYKLLREAGADRYLLRHESVNEDHYKKLHPKSMQISNRLKALEDLKALKFQVGAGMMIGSPFQELHHLAQDLYYLQRLKPEMIGTGPFIHHDKTPFKDEEDGNLELSLYILSLLRLNHPYALIPSTTALHSLSPEGRISGLNAGANVIMPNVSPNEARDAYELYKNKKNTGLEVLEGLQELSEALLSHDYYISWDRGDYKGERYV